MVDGLVVTVFGGGGKTLLNFQGVFGSTVQYSSGDSRQYRKYFAEDIVHTWKAVRKEW